MNEQRPQWLPYEQYPFDLKTIDLPTGTVTYIDEGAGPTLLFVNAGMWSFVFRDVITRLRDEFRCITLDFPGFGLSPALPQDLEIREMAQLLEQFTSSLNLNDITLVAHDLGGLVSLHQAGPTAARYRGLVLANSFAWTPNTVGLRTMFRLMGGRAMTTLGTMTNLIPKLSATSFGVGKHLPSEGKAAFLGPYRDRSVRRRFHTTMKSAFKDPDFTAEVEAAAQGPLNSLPVLTIFGEKNDPFGFQDRHVATFPDCESLVIEKGNHFPMTDDPDGFAASLRDWHVRKVAIAYR